MRPVPLTSLKIAVKEHQCFQVLKAHIDKLEVFCNVCSRSINMSKSNHAPTILRAVCIRQTLKEASSHTGSSSTYCDQNIYDEKWKKMMEMTQNAKIIVL